MPLDASLVGRQYPETAPYEVAREKVREFAVAVREDPAIDVAPPTFPFVVAWRALTPLFGDPALGIALEQVVHGEQRFAMSRPLIPGDRVTAAATVESVRSLGPATLIGVRVDLRLEGADETLGSAWSSLVVSAPRTASPAAEGGA
jgi:N-terminal half of MaoC dehydratase